MSAGQLKKEIERSLPGYNDGEEDGAQDSPEQSAGEADSQGTEGDDENKDLDGSPDGEGYDEVDADDLDSPPSDGETLHYKSCVKIKRAITQINKNIVNVDGWEPGEGSNLQAELNRLLEHIQSELN